ncbi:MAG: hypothetical protein U5K79_02180 [Cyclobacteriaceae bacterium]|nr:hypothetical protein [Cyclobacteriaceae bacterium]
MTTHHKPVEKIGGASGLLICLMISVSQSISSTLFAKQGYYRIFVLLVTSDPLTFDTENEFDYCEAQGLVE